MFVDGGDVVVVVGSAVMLAGGGLEDWIPIRLNMWFFWHH